MPFQIGNRKRKHPALDNLLGTEDLSVQPLTLPRSRFRQSSPFGSPQAQGGPALYSPFAGEDATFYSRQSGYSLPEPEQPDLWRQAMDSSLEQRVESSLLPTAQSENGPRGYDVPLGKEMLDQAIQELSSSPQTADPLMTEPQYGDCLMDQQLFDQVMAQATHMAEPAMPDPTAMDPFQTEMQMYDQQMAAMMNPMMPPGP